MSTTLTDAPRFAAVLRCRRWAWRWEGGLPRAADHRAGCATRISFDDAGTLWRLCTRMITPVDAGRRVAVIGDREIADHFLRITSIIR